MIEHNKYVPPVIKNLSSDRTIRKVTTKNKIKLTKENKRFLKLIGLSK